MIKPQDLTDLWSIPHFLSGFLFLYVNNHLLHIKPFWVVFLVGSAIHLVYEIKDYIVSYIPGVFPYISNRFPTLTDIGIIDNRNSICNSYGDQFYFMVGLLFAHYYRKYTNVGTALYVIFIGISLITYLQKRKDLIHEI